MLPTGELHLSLRDLARPLVPGHENYVIVAVHWSMAHKQPIEGNVKPCRNLLEPSGTFWNLLESSGTLEFQVDHTQTDRHKDLLSCIFAVKKV